MAISEGKQGQIFNLFILVECQNLRLFIINYYLTPILAQDWSPSLYEDVGRLLSVYAAVESAEIPTDMDKLADAILLRGETDTFIATKTSKDAISWLQSDPFLAKELETFFIKHGHRSIAEVTKIWSYLIMYIM